MAVSKQSSMNAGSPSGSKALPPPNGHPKTAIKSPSAITFVRNRMFYARAVLNAKGKVRFGLRHIRRLPSLWSYSENC